MRLLIIGASGMLGGMCAALFRQAGLDVLAPASAGLDITDAVSLRQYLDRFRPDVVLNCAVFKQFSEVGSWPRGFAVNSLGPMYLSVSAAELGFHLIQVSTDTLFGTTPGPFDESSPVTPEGPYAVSKRGGEVDGALVLRGSFIGPGHAARPSLLERLRQGGSVEAGAREQWNGLTSLEFAEGLLGYLASGRNVTGIRHVHGPDLDRLELCRSIKAQFGFSGKVIETARANDRRLASLHADVGVPVVEENLRLRLSRLKDAAAALGLW